VAYPQAAVSQAAKSIVAFRKLGGSCRLGIMLKKQKSTWNIDDPKCREKQDDSIAPVIGVSAAILLMFFLVLASLYWRS
jgi:hypothetical protein